MVKFHSIIKRGPGPTVGPNDTINIHVRAALTPENFNSDGDVVFSTYKSNEVTTLQMSDPSLLDGVKSALLGKSVGTTLILKGNKDQEAQQALYIEIWIEEIINFDAKRVRISSYKTEGSKSEIRALYKVFLDAHSQKNGRSVKIPKQMLPVYNDLISKFYVNNGDSTKPTQQSIHANYESEDWLFPEREYDGILTQIRTEIDD